MTLNAAHTRATTIRAHVADWLDQAEREGLEPGFSGFLGRKTAHGLREILDGLDRDIAIHHHGEQA